MKPLFLTPISLHYEKVLNFQVSRGAWTKSLNLWANIVYKEAVLFLDPKQKLVVLPQDFFNFSGTYAKWTLLVVGPLFF